MPICSLVPDFLFRILPDGVYSGVETENFPGASYKYLKY